MEIRPQAMTISLWPSFQVCWEVLRVDVMNIFNDFHARGKLKGASMPLLLSLFPRSRGGEY